MLRFVIVNSVTLAYIDPSCAIPQLQQRVFVYGVRVNPRTRNTRGGCGIRRGF